MSRVDPKDDLRARYMNAATGRFWTRDAFEGGQEDPLSLHRYLYVSDDPVNGTDPSGYDGDLTTLLAVTELTVMLAAIEGCSPGSAIAHTDSVDVKLTGAEPAYNPGLWNGPNYVTNNNCYAYAVNNPVPTPTRSSKPQPGYKAWGVSPASADCNVAYITAASVADGLTYLGATPSSTSSTPSADYVVALVIDPGVDYHWYRHNRDGTWSSKSGSEPANNVDASGKVIQDPRTANRNYAAWVLNYTLWGGYFAVPPGMQVKP